MTSKALNRRMVSSGTMTAVWFCAIAIAASAMVGLLTMAPESEWLRSRPYAVFIGTSLTLNALPSEQFASNFFLTVTEHDRFVRMASNAISDTEIVQRVEHAVLAGVKRIFVEIDPLLRTYRSVYKLPAGIRAIQEFSERLRFTLREQLRLHGDDPGGAAFDGFVGGQPVDFLIHAPRHPAGIAKVLELAKNRELDIVWVAMPRSQSAADQLGPAFESAFASRLQEFALAMGANVWRPTIAWPDELFKDRAHLNSAGRERFMTELRRHGMGRQ